MLTAVQSKIVREIRRLHARRVPLNISAVKRSHPELLERAYAVRPFWGWKKALEDAGLDYSKINIELRDYVDCKVCGRDLGNLGYHLISQHQITSEDYWAEHPGAELVCETARARMGRYRSTPRITLPRWEEVWTPEYILDRIAELRRQKLPLHFEWANHHEQALAVQAIHCFGSWDEALRRIGLDPAQIRRAAPTEHLTAADVIARLRKRGIEGLPLNFGAVQEGDSPLSNAIRKYFASHEHALRAAGIDPAGVCKIERLSEEKIAAFLADARRVAKLRGKAHLRAWLRLEKKYHDLAALKRFGGWKGVAAKIGVPLERLVWKRFRDRDDVMAELRERARLGKSLQAQRILKEDLSLRTAVLKYLGSFEEVYRQFGIQPPRESRWRRADKAQIIDELRRRQKADEAMSWRKILHAPAGPAFLIRAKTLFGSWSNALSAAGLDPFGGALSSWGTADAVFILAEIRRRKRGREPLRFSKIATERGGQPLLKRATQLFGSWNAALTAAGIEPEGGYSQWAKANKALIEAELRRRERAGETLRSSRVAKEKWGRALGNRCGELFGSWNAALRAAGIGPARENSRWPHAGEAAVLAEIRRRKRAGLTLATTKIEREKWGCPLLNRAKALFGSWGAALLAAGVDPPVGIMSPWPKANKTDIVAEIRRRERAREILRYSELVREPWGAALLKRAERLFGSWTAALLAAEISPPAGAFSPWRDAVKADILAEIQRRKGAGESVRAHAIEKEQWGRALLRRGRELFGSWNDVLLAVGADLPPNLTSPWPKADRAAIVAEIRRRKRTREPLRSTDIKTGKWGKPLLRRGRVLFGSWDAALAAAGADPHKRR